MFLKRMISFYHTLTTSANRNPLNSRMKSVNYTGIPSTSNFATNKDNCSHLDQALTVEPANLNEYDGPFRCSIPVTENTPSAWKISIKAKRRKIYKFPGALRLLEKKCRDVGIHFLLVEDGDDLKFVPASDFFLISEFSYERIY